MKGIILAGGSGTRLYPATLSLSKQLLPVYDKPMIYYPLSTLMLAGIREILIISTPRDLPRFQDLLGDGASLGISLSYREQKEPKGLAESFLIGESFIGQDPVALILGDNIFYGHGLSTILERSAKRETGALIFGYHVKDPSRYGVISFDERGQVTDIVEKPEHPPSSYAAAGLYFYGPEVIAKAKQLTPSERGELEITDLNRLFLKEKTLSVEILGRGHAWLDTGTFDALQKAAQFVQTIQERQGVQIACIEEIAYQKGYISLEALQNLLQRYPNGYGQSRSLSRLSKISS